MTYQIKAETMAYRVEADGYYVLVKAQGHDEAAEIGARWLDDPVTAVSGPYPLKASAPYVNAEYGKVTT